MGNAKRDMAVKKLKFYFRILFEKAGLGWTPDNDSEIEFLIDEIIGAVMIETM